MWTLCSFITAWITANTEHMDTGPSLYPSMVQGLKRFFSSSWLNCSLVGVAPPWERLSHIFAILHWLETSHRFCLIQGEEVIHNTTQVQGQNQEAMQIQPASSATSVLHTVCSAPGPELLHDFSVVGSEDCSLQTISYMRKCLLCFPLKLSPLSPVWRNFCLGHGSNVHMIRKRRLVGQNGCEP